MSKINRRRKRYKNYSSITTELPLEIHLARTQNGNLLLAFHVSLYDISILFHKKALKY